MWKIARPLLLGILFGLAGCDAGETEDAMPLPRLSDLSDTQMHSLSERTFFFGHQSVGGNLMDGLAMVLKENPAIRIAIVDGETADSLQPGTLLHSRIGRNGAPQTKIDRFGELMEHGIGGRADAAFVKFCYVDAGRDSDMQPDQLFASYRQTIEQLKAKYPDTVFIHFTMPLRTVPDGLKVRIKNLIGRDIPEYRDNAERGRFNELLRQHYAGEPIFDIAQLEAAAPAAGRRYGFRLDGKRYETLAPQNTYDGGHLTDGAKRWMAEQLLIFLARLEYKSEPGRSG